MERIMPGSDASRECTAVAPSESTFRALPWGMSAVYTVGTVRSVGSVDRAVERGHVARRTVHSLGCSPPTAGNTMNGRKSLTTFHASLLSSCHASTLHTAVRLNLVRARHDPATAKILAGNSISPCRPHPSAGDRCMHAITACSHRQGK